MTNLTKPVVMILLISIFAVAAVAGGPADRFEVGLLQSLAEARAEWPRLTALVAGLTNLGGAYVTLSVTAAASLWLLFRRQPAVALLLVATVLVERTLVEFMKDWIGRPRPHFGVDWLPSSLAFPSGHSANSLTAFLAAALIVAAPARRGPWVMGALLLALVVGLSRIYLGVHWPSDVIGGWAFGLLAVGLALQAGRRLGLLEPQHQIVGRHRPALPEDKTA
ncbi:phosphatase PAP2 family protein [Sphingomonas sp. RB56-2]|uniref:Phosphatase PAP2 family protein n=1 Tax=Sphingomonas brevis TaxID=2908206 RepID=A0ABT0S6E1_9SPHN|nr:phosphatase PAP2 family protein [Sphingomonas brevis]MCL6739961.1 phosphatase PAP2 family protein [Sphingomonas brevis]